jgi:hypothetical protein
LAILILPAVLSPVAGASWPIPGVMADPLPTGAAVSVNLTLDASAYPVAALAETTTCRVSVPSQAKVSNALDRAVADRCFAGWIGTTCASCVTGGFGRFVLSVDGRSADCDGWAVGACSYYLYEDNGVGASQGVDALQVQDGHTYTFVFHDDTVLPP